VSPQVARALSWWPVRARPSFLFSRRVGQYQGVFCPSVRQPESVVSGSSGRATNWHLLVNSSQRSPAMHLSRIPVCSGIVYHSRAHFVRMIILQKRPLSQAADCGNNPQIVYQRASKLANLRKVICRIHWRTVGQDHSSPHRPGLGDTIQYVRYVPYLVRQGARRLCLVAAANWFFTGWSSRPLGCFVQGEARTL